jgi:predicted AlkP superfamily phosphohydrolase/phosphomutase
VEPGEVRALRDELAARIATIQIDGRPLVDRVFTKEEIFTGPHLDLAPDLCVLPNKGFDLKGAVNKTELCDREVFTGMHTQDDALFWINSDKVRDGDPNIVDVAPTILDALAIETPASMDGRSLFRR